MSVRCFDEFGGVFGVRAGGGRVWCGAAGGVDGSGFVAGGRWWLIVSLGSQIFVCMSFVFVKKKKSDLSLVCKIVLR